MRFSKDSIERAKKVLDLANDGRVTYDDLKSLFTALQKVILEARKSLEARVDSALDTLTTKTNERLSKVKDGKDGKDGAKGDKGGKGDKGDPGESISGPAGRDGKDGSPDMAEDIRNKLELLDGDERLKIEAIRDLREALDELKAQTAKVVSGGVRRVFQPHLEDKSADCDGSNKTFSLTREPLRTSTIEVHCTDFPIILRPTVDFTVAGKVVTLTSQVAAPTQGATLLIKYYA